MFQSDREPLLRLVHSLRIFVEPHSRQPKDSDEILFFEMSKDTLQEAAIRLDCNAKANLTERDERKRRRVVGGVSEEREVEWGMGAKVFEI